MRYRPQLSLRGAFEEAFHRLGGVEGLVKWGAENPTEFYRLIARMLPTHLKAEVEPAPWVESGKSIVDWFLERAGPSPHPLFIEAQPVIDTQITSSEPPADEGASSEPNGVDVLTSLIDDEKIEHLPVSRGEHRPIEAQPEVGQRRRRLR
jgi:hypothetical protein